MFHLITVDVDPVYIYDELKAYKVILKIKQDALDSVTETSYSLVEDKLEITEGKSGKSINESKLTEDVLNQYVKKDKEDIIAEIYETHPKLTIEDLTSLKSQYDNLINSKISFVYDRKQYLIDKADILKIFIIEKQDEKPFVSINNIALTDKVTAISLQLDQNPKGQVLEIENGRAVKFIASEDGLKVKIKDSVEDLGSGLENIIIDSINNKVQKDYKLTLVVQVTEAPIADSEFKIEDLLGEGKSKFKGSIPGRIHNIQLAASRVNGILVPPGEIFSFNESVGEITRKTGYTSAYVISGGRTVLGDGGVYAKYQQRFLGPHLTPDFL
jgi:vancomycin resistance protein YoaR